MLCPMPCTPSSFCLQILSGCSIPEDFSPASWAGDEACCHHRPQHPHSAAPLSGAVNSSCHRRTRQAGLLAEIRGLERGASKLQ